MPSISAVTSSGGTTVPANHAGYMTLTLTGVGTSWTTATAFTVANSSSTAAVGTSAVYSATAAIVTVATGAGTGSFTISDGTTTSSGITVAASSLTISSSTAIPGGVQLSLTSTNTLWNNEVPSSLFTVTGGTNAGAGLPSTVVTMAAGSSSASAGMTLAPAGLTCPPNPATITPTLPGTVVNIDAGWLSSPSSTGDSLYTIPGTSPADKIYILKPSVPTLYKLQTNVTVNGNGFVIGTSGCVFDLNGYTLTFDNSTPIQMNDASGAAIENGSFENGSGLYWPEANMVSGPQVSGPVANWDVSQVSPAPSIVANTFYLWGNNVLEFTGFSATESIYSDPIAIPTVGVEYAATIAMSYSSGTPYITISLLDATTNATITPVTDNTTGETATRVTNKGYAGIDCITPTSTNPVRLAVAITTTATSDILLLDYATFTRAHVYGIIACSNSGHLPVYLLGGSVSSACTAFNSGGGVFTLINSSPSTGGIFQGQQQSYNSNCVYGWANVSTSSLTILNVSMSVNGVDSGCVNAESCENVQTQGCTYNSTVKCVSNRMTNSLVTHLDLNNGGTYALIDRNTFLNDPLVGIALGSRSNVTISNNKFSPNTIATDGYAIGAVGGCSFVYIFGNSILDANSGGGRGVLIDSIGNSTPNHDFLICKNWLDVREKPDAEYGVTGLQCCAIRERVQCLSHYNINVFDNALIARTGIGNDLQSIGVFATTCPHLLPRQPLTFYNPGDNAPCIYQGGKYYTCTTSGVSGATLPTFGLQTVTDGTVVWTQSGSATTLNATWVANATYSEYSGSGTTPNIVSYNGYYYVCTGSGVTGSSASPTFNTSPTNSSTPAITADGTVVWTCLGTNGANIVYQNNLIKGIVECNADYGGNPQNPYAGQAVSLEGAGLNYGPQFIGNVLESNDVGIQFGGIDGAISYAGTFVSNILKLSSEGVAQSAYNSATYRIGSANNIVLADSQYTGGATWSPAMGNTTQPDAWTASHTYTFVTFNANPGSPSYVLNAGWYWACVQPGTSGVSNPFLGSPTVGQQITDGGVIWICVGQNIIDTSIEWLLNLVVQTAGGSPISGATVTITDKNGATVYPPVGSTGTTGSDGRLTGISVLSSLYALTTYNGTPTTTTSEPHTLTITAAGYATYTLGPLNFATSYPFPLGIGNSTTTLGGNTSATFNLVLGNSANPITITDTSTGATTTYTFSAGTITAGSVTVTSITTNSLTVTATSTGGSAPLTYQFYRSTNGSSYSTLGSSQSSNVYNDTGLTAGTNYWYKCDVTDATPTTVHDPAVEITTLPQITPVVNIGTVTSVSISLSCTVSGGSGVYPIYILYRSQTAGVQGTQIASNVSSFTDTWLQSGGTYYYTWVVVDNTGNRGTSAQVAQITTITRPWAWRARAFMAWMYNWMGVDIFFSITGTVYRNQYNTVLTLVGVRTNWTSGTVFSADIATVVSQTVTDGTHATITVNTSAIGTLTISDGSYTAYIQVVNPPITANPVAFFGITNTSLYAIEYASGGDGGPYTYSFDRAPDSSGSPGTWTLAVGTTSPYQNTGLTHNNKYWYRCTVQDSSGNSATSTPDSIIVMAHADSAFNSQALLTAP